MAFGTVLILTIVVVFGWYRWVLMRAYKQFPATRMDTTWLLRMVFGRYPKNASPTSLFLSGIVEKTKQFQAEGLCVVWLFRPCLVVFSHDIMKVLLNDPAVIDKSRLFEAAREIFGNGLVGKDGETWKFHRKQLNPAFTSGVLKGKIPTCNNNAIELVEKLQKFENTPVVNLVHILKNCSFNILTESVFGIRLDNEKYRTKSQNFMKSLSRASNLGFARLSYPWLLMKPLLPFSTLGKKYLDAVEEMRRFTYEIVEEQRKCVALSDVEESSLDGTTEVSKSMTQILLEQQLKNPAFTNEDLRDHLENIIIAGFDSTAVAIMWCMYLLGHNPEAQQKVYNEVMSVAPTGHVTCDHLGELKYLDCVIKETLRLYPPLALYARKTNKHIQCGKYTIPKETDIVFAPFLLHRNPYVYPEPQKFDPERFCGSSEIRPWMHVPFAEGYRSCIGKKFAVMEAKIILAHVVRRFKMETLNKIDDSELDWTMVLKPVKRIQILFTNRCFQS